MRSFADLAGKAIHGGHAFARHRVEAEGWDEARAGQHEPDVAIGVGSRGVDGVDAWLWFVAGAANQGSSATSENYAGA
jgi:hypothetical protein